MARRTTFLIAVAAALLASLLLAGAALAQTPIEGGASFGAAEELSPDTVYSDSVSDTDGDLSHYYFDVNSGQWVTVFITSTTTWSDGVYFEFYDQDHDNTLSEEGIYGPEQSLSFGYMGNNTTPTRYYLVAGGYAGDNEFEFSVQITDQKDAGASGDAGDASTSARLLAPAPNATTTYNGNLLGYADSDDWYQLNFVSGQIITVTVPLPAFEEGNALFVDLRTDQGSVASDNIFSDATDPLVLTWMSNNTPGPYYLHIQDNGYPSMVYEFDVELGQQSDGNVAGDAGDTFNEARDITLDGNPPGFSARRNLLGGSDAIDYYFFEPSSMGPGMAARQYQFCLQPAPWPGETGQLTVTFYQSNREEASIPVETIIAPSVAPYCVDLTPCSSWGCFFQIQGYADGGYQTYYTSITSPIRVYLPALMRR